MNPLATPDRIAFAGDWHMNTRWALDAIHYAQTREADVIVHLGDFGYTFERRYLDQLDKKLKKTELPLLFVDGNHECFPRLYEYEIQPHGLRQLRDNIWHLPRGFRWDWDGVKFLALGGAHSVDRQMRQEGVSWWHEETIPYRLAMEVAYAGPADVMVTHDCPSDVPWLDTQLANNEWRWPTEEVAFSEGHRKLLRAVTDSVKPRFLWHGHYHVFYSQIVNGTEFTGLNCDHSSICNNVDIVDLEYIKEGL